MTTNPRFNIGSKVYHISNGPGKVISVLAGKDKIQYKVEFIYSTYNGKDFIDKTRNITIQEENLLSPKEEEKRIHKEQLEKVERKKRIERKKLLERDRIDADNKRNLIVGIVIGVIILLWYIISISSK